MLEENIMNQEEDLVDDEIIDDVDTDEEDDDASETDVDHTESDTGDALIHKLITAGKIIAAGFAIGGLIVVGIHTKAKQKRKARAIKKSEGNVIDVNFDEVEESKEPEKDAHPEIKSEKAKELLKGESERLANSKKAK